MFRLIATSQSLRGVDEVARLFNNVALAVTQRDEDDMAAAIRHEFRRNFGNHSSAQGPWAALAPSTIQDRLRLGFGPGPTLVRTGNYRASFVSSGAQHYSQAWRSSGLFALEEGSESVLATFHEGGTRRMPARPVTDLDSAAEGRIGRAVDQVLHRLFARRGL